MHAPLPALLVVLAAGLSGCVGTGGSEPPPEPTTVNPPSTPPEAPEVPTAPAVAVNVTPFEGDVFGAGLADGPKVAGPGSNFRFEFPVEANASGIVVEVLWDGGGSLAVSVGIPPEHCTEATPATADCDNPPAAEGPSPLRVAVTEPERLAYEGAWSVRVFLVGASATPVAFQAYASVFHGGAPGEGYTATARAD